MIIDTIENAHLYHGISDGFKTAFEYLKKTDFTNMEGEHEIDGRDVYLIMNRYNTKPESEGKLEGHRKYIDIQYIFEGDESIGYVPLKDQEVMEVYDGRRDVVFYEGKGSFTHLKKGMFGIYFPMDLHMPCIGDGKPIIKVVVKVRYGLLK